MENQAINPLPVPPVDVWLGPDKLPASPMCYADPTGYWRQQNPHVTIGELQEALGLLPGIFLRACDQLRHDRDGMQHTDAEALTDKLTKNMADVYGFGWPTMPEGSVVTEAGVYTYPEDPDLHPYASVKHPCGAVMVVYPYAIIAVRVGDAELRIARMD